MFVLAYLPNNFWNAHIGLNKVTCDYALECFNCSCTNHYFLAEPKIDNENIFNAGSLLYFTLIVLQLVEQVKANRK